MNEKYLDPIRNKLIKETADTIRAYLKLRSRSAHYASNLPAHLCDFFGGATYTDGLSNYPGAAADTLAALTDKKVAEPFMEVVGEYNRDYLVDMLKNVIELCHWLNANPAHEAEMDLHLYTESDPGGDAEQVQRDLDKYTALLNYETEMAASEKKFR